MTSVYHFKHGRLGGTVRAAILAKMGSQYCFHGCNDGSIESRWNEKHLQKTPGYSKWPVDLATLQRLGDSRESLFLSTGAILSGLYPHGLRSHVSHG
jgi:hypothetical protein